VNIAAPINEFSPASTFATLPTSSAATSTSSHSSTSTPSTSAKASPTATATHSGTPAPQRGLSAGIIAGIVMGVIILLVGLGLGALLLWRRRRHTSASTSVPIEQYVRPYEAALAPARPGSEKTAVFLPGSSARNLSGSSAGNASSSSAAAPSAAGPEAEDRFEERFQNRLMQFLRTNMDPPHVAGEALPSYPGPSNV
jgi:predicted lipid-binding transport protein (Tim44 family)